MKEISNKQINNRYIIMIILFTLSLCSFLFLIVISYDNLSITINPNHSSIIGAFATGLAYSVAIAVLRLYLLIISSICIVLSATTIIFIKFNKKLFTERNKKVLCLIFLIFSIFIFIITIILLITCFATPIKQNSSSISSLLYIFFN